MHNSKLYKTSPDIAKITSWISGVYECHLCITLAWKWSQLSLYRLWAACHWCTREGINKRSFDTCHKEHQAATRRGETDKSAIAEHAWAKQHRPQWDNITWPRMEPHHLAGQGSITHHVGRATLTPQPRPGNSRRGLLESWRPLLKCASWRVLTWHQLIPSESKICSIEL